MKFHLFALFMAIGAGLLFLAGCPSKNNPASPAPTDTPFPTFSPTATVTRTSTGTPLNTATKTPTATITSTPTPTASFTITNTPTNSPTFTSTVTYTYTATPAFTCVGQWYAQPGALAVDPTTHNIVANNQGCLEIFDNTGSPVTTYCNTGSGTGQLNGIGGIAVDQSGDIFVADSGNNRVEVFDPSLNCINQWGGTAPSPGSGNGDLNDPVGIALDNGGSASASVYVVDAGNRRVQKFTHSGAYVTQWSINYATSPVPTPFPTQAIYQIATGPLNQVYVTGNGFSTVYRTASDGSSMTPFPCPENSIPGALDPAYRGIAVDSSGSMYIACGDSGGLPGSLRKLDSSGNMIGQFHTNNSGGVTLSFPIGVALDGPSTIYVSDYGADKIFMFTQ